jgi:hypothetical protein
MGPGKQTAKNGLVWRNRKKISQIIKDYFYLPFFLLIILWLLRTKVKSYYERTMCMLGEQGGGNI